MWCGMPSTSPPVVCKRYTSLSFSRALVLRNFAFSSLFTSTKTSYINIKSTLLVKLFKAVTMIPERLEDSQEQGSRSRFRNERDLTTTDLFTHSYSKESLSSSPCQALFDGTSLVRSRFERFAADMGFYHSNSQLSVAFTDQVLLFKAATLFPFHSRATVPTRELPHNSWKTAFPFSLFARFFERFPSFPTFTFLSFHYWLPSLLWQQRLFEYSTALKLLSSVSQASWWELEKWTFRIFSCFFTSTSLSPLLLSLTLYPHSLPPFLLAPTFSAVSLSRLELILSNFFSAWFHLSHSFSLSPLLLSLHPQDHSTQDHCTHTLPSPTYALLNHFTNFLLHNSFYYLSTLLASLIPDSAMPKR